MSSNAFVLLSLILISMLVMEAVVGHVKSRNMLRQFYGLVLTAVGVTVVFLGGFVLVEQSPKQVAVAQAKTQLPVASQDLPEPIVKPCMRSCDYDWNGLKVFIRGTAVSVANPTPSLKGNDGKVELWAYYAARTSDRPRKVWLGSMESCMFNLHGKDDGGQISILSGEAIRTFQLNECANCVPY